MTGVTRTGRAHERQRRDRERFQTAGGPNFPLTEDKRFIFPSERGIWHSAYFEQPETIAHLKQWLTEPEQRPVA